MGEAESTMPGVEAHENSAAASATPAAPWSEPDPDRPLPFWSGLRADIAAHRQDRGRSSRLVETAGVVVRSAGFHVLIVHRLAHALAHRAGLAGRIGAGLLFWGIRHCNGCSIASTARLYGGLILPHPQGIVIGPGVVVGPRAWIFQNVTIGGAPGKIGMPRVGADARIYCGAVLTGPVRLGDNVMVGANAVVARDVPDRTLVRCAATELVPLPEPYHCRD